MKKYLHTPFSFIFTIVLVVVLGAKPNQSLAQENKVVRKSIIIKNGDTIINGQNLKDASRSERKKLVKELEGIRLGQFNHEPPHPPESPTESQVIIRKKKDGEPEQIIVKRLNAPKVMILKDGETLLSDRHAEIDSMIFRLDSNQLKNMQFQVEKLDGKLKIMGDDSSFDLFVPTPDLPNGPHLPMMKRIHVRTNEENEKNSQNFSYSSTDKDGISNRLHIRLMESANESVAKITGSEKANNNLMVDDLNIFPSFSTGKINVTFSLKSKGALEVKIMDNNLQPVFSDKQPNFNESYYKSFTLPKNGIYYLVLNQGANWWIKKMIKE